jgi:hypothetical protein
MARVDGRLAPASGSAHDRSCLRGHRARVTTLERSPGSALKLGGHALELGSDQVEGSNAPFGSAEDEGSLHRRNGRDGEGSRPRTGDAGIDELLSQQPCPGSEGQSANPAESLVVRVRINDYSGDGTARSTSGGHDRGSEQRHEVSDDAGRLSSRARSLIRQHFVVRPSHRCFDELLLPSGEVMIDRAARGSARREDLRERGRLRPMGPDQRRRANDHSPTAIVTHVVRRIGRPDKALPNPAGSPRREALYDGHHNTRRALHADD